MSTYPPVYEKFDEHGPTGEEFIRIDSGYWMTADEFFGAGGGNRVTRSEIIDPAAGESLVRTWPR